MTHGYDVWAVLGQSNTLYGAGLDPTLDTPHPRVDQLAGRGPMFGQIVPAREPLLHPVDVGERIGFALAFARVHVESLDVDRRLLLIPAGKGASGFRPWAGYTWDRHDATTPFNLARFANMQIATALAGSANRLAGILWHQGEHDTAASDAARYADRLVDLLASLRRRFGDNAMILVGQMNPDHMDRVRSERPGFDDVDRAHREVVRRLDNAAFVPGPRGATNGPSDTIHYSAPGQRELGRRCAAAAAALSGGDRLRPRA